MSLKDGADTLACAAPHVQSPLATGGGELPGYRARVRVGFGREPQKSRPVNLHDAHEVHDGDDRAKITSTRRVDAI